MLAIKDEELKEMSEYIQGHFGINLSAKRTLIEGRLNSVIADRGYESFQDYFRAVLKDTSGQEISLLIDKLTTNHTFFMREATHFQFFRDSVLPWLESTVRDRDLRIWSAGCSTGEEPYTLAMILSDYFSADKGAWDKQVLATDISTQVLKKAVEGRYPAESVESLPAVWKLNYFLKDAGDHFRVKDTIRNQLIYRSFNLMEPQFPFRKQFHVIFCRNVMIYFNQKTKMELIQKFYDHTVPGGYLFIGHSESIPKGSDGYRYVMPAVYRKP